MFGIFASRLADSFERNLKELKQKAELIHKVHSKHSDLDNLPLLRGMEEKVLALRNVRRRFAVNNLNKKHFRPWLDTPLFSFSLRICFPIVFYLILVVLQINIYFDNVAEIEQGVSECFYTI